MDKVFKQIALNAFKGGIMGTQQDAALSDAAQLTEFYREIEGAYLATESFRQFLLRTIPKAAKIFRAQNLQIKTPVGAELLFEDGESRVGLAKTVWDTVWGGETWALYEPAPKDSHGTGNYHLEKPDLWKTMVM